MQPSTTASLPQRFSLLRRIAKRLRLPTIIWRSKRDDRVALVEVRQWLPIILFIGTLIWYLAAPTAISVMSLVMIAGVLLIAAGWILALAWGVTGKRVLRYAAVQVGDELEELILLENNSFFPLLWAEFIDHSNLPGYNANSVRAVDPRNSTHWVVQALCSQRGVFSLGPWDLRLGDPFGIFLVRLAFGTQQEILVYPPLAVLPAHLLPYQATLGEHRQLRHPFPAETTNAMYTRPYQPGDALRHLHWRTTARRAAPFVKVFEPEATSTIWLVPDFDPRAHVGEGNDSTEETMVILTGSLALQLLEKRLMVGMLTYTDKLTVVPPRSGELHLWQILRALTPLHTPNAPPLAETLNHAQLLVSARAQIIVITPSLNAAWPPKLKLISQRGRGAEAILLDPASFDLSSGSVLRTPASGRDVDVRSETFVELLADLGLAAKVVRRGEIRASAPVYGSPRRWEFITLSSGRAVARQTPRSADSLSLPIAGSISHEKLKESR
jgi:uncharacterized protein (DUF58 family)